MTTRLLAACLVVALLKVGGFGFESSYRRELDSATLQVMDAAIRADGPGLSVARARVERALPEAVAAGDLEAAASARFHLALATWMGIWMGVSEEADPARAIRGALADLDASIAARDEARAHMLAVMCHVTLFRFGAGDAAVGATIGKHAQRAKELDPNDPRAGMFAGLMSAYDPTGPARPAGVKRLEDVCAALERDRQERRRLADWWDVTALEWLARVYLASETPDREKTRATIEKALALRPDSVAVRELLGATDLEELAPVDALRGARWTLVTEDARGDGRAPALADARALYVSAAPIDGRVWFRFDLYGEVSPKSLGVNLVLDVDGDQATGMAWWGGKPDFRFDRLITVWITSPDGLHYSGYVGASDARAAGAGRTTTEARNDVDVAIDPAARSVFIGIRRADLGATPKSVVRGAVGSHVIWNDELSAAPLGAR
jgi:hypothetical protein